MYLDLFFSLFVSNYATISKYGKKKEKAKGYLIN